MLGRGGEVGEVLTGLAAGDPLHHEQRAVAVAQPVLHLVGKERARHRVHPRGRTTARRTANSSAAFVGSKPTGRSLRTITLGRELRRCPTSETRMVSLERPPGTTSTRRHRELGRGGELAAEVGGELLGSITEHSVAEAAASASSRSSSTARRSSSTRSRKRRSTSTSVAAELAVRRIGAPGGRSATRSAARRRSSPNCSGVTGMCSARWSLSSSSSASNSAPYSLLSASAHSSSTMNSARIRSTRAAASTAVGAGQLRQEDGGDGGAQLAVVQRPVVGGLPHRLSGVGPPTVTTRPAG